MSEKLGKWVSRVVGAYINVQIHLRKRERVSEKEIGFWGVVENINERCSVISGGSQNLYVIFTRVVVRLGNE